MYISHITDKQFQDFFMDDLLIIIYYWVKRKWQFYLYNYRGKKNSSFVDYGIALCYENEYEAKFNRTRDGKGEVMIDACEYNYHIYSDISGKFVIELLGALCLQPAFVEFAKSLVSQSTSGSKYVARYNENGNILIDIGCTIEANAKEKNARFYINGYVQEVLTHKQEQLIKDFESYKRNHPVQKKNKYDYEALTSLYTD